MDMKIQSELLAESSSLQSARTEHPSRTEGPRAGSASSGGSFDRVDLSSTAQRISEVTAAEDLRASERIRELTKVYNSGLYHVEAEQLSRALIASALEDER